VSIPLQISIEYEIKIPEHERVFKGFFRRAKAPHDVTESFAQLSRAGGPNLAELDFD
jgi:hypothetical protein